MEVGTGGRHDLGRQRMHTRERASLSTESYRCVSPTTELTPCSWPFPTHRNQLCKPSTGGEKPSACEGGGHLPSPLSAHRWCGYLWIVSGLPWGASQGGEI